jgi:hypothetical protein
MPDHQPSAAVDAVMLEWLLHAEEPWARYNALRDLAGAPAEAPETRAAYAAMQAHPAVADLFAALAPWPPAAPLARAYDPKDSLWKLATLADFGLARDDPRVAALAEAVFAAQAEGGGFLHGGFDHTKTWDARPYICIAHVMTYALARFGYGDDPRLGRAYAQIAAWQRDDGGWHPNQANLPGGKGAAEPSCPFGTGNVLRALAAHPQWRGSAVAERGAGYLLTCWERRAEPYRPVGFGIGSTWLKSQYPFVQYQFLKTVDTLSRIPAAGADPRYREMVAHLESKRDDAGRWSAEGVNKPWSAFDFGQKKTPSPWITLLALGILRRSAAPAAP